MGGVPFGTKLLINGNVYTVEDRGTGYGHVDIYMDSHSATIFAWFLDACRKGAGSPRRMGDARAD